MTPEQLTELDRLYQESTQGPWEQAASRVTDKLGDTLCRCETMEDATFIASAHTAVPLLIERVRTLEKRIRESTLVAEYRASAEQIWRASEADTAGRLETAADDFHKELRMILGADFEPAPLPTSIPDGGDAGVVQ